VLVQHPAVTALTAQTLFFTPSRLPVVVAVVAQSPKQAVLVVVLAVVRGQITPD
jgi:hypothetical protein